MIAGGGILDRSKSGKLARLMAEISLAVAVGFWSAAILIASRIKES